MKLKLLKPNKSLRPAYRLLKPKRDDLETFKEALTHYFSVIDETESEENLKTHFLTLLKECVGKDYLVEPQQRIDFVIRNGKKDEKAGVLGEAKRSSNKQEMITADNINKKALHESVLYFLQERKAENTDIKKLIILSEKELFLFEAKSFEKLFYNNKSFYKEFKDWSEGKKTNDTTDFFYNSIAKPFVEKINVDIEATYIDFSKYQKALEQDDEKKLIELYKILSAEHLLHKPFANDSNSLNKEFYDELLHIIGLEEVGSGKKTIERKSAKERSPASLLESVMHKVKKEDEFSSQEIVFGYGAKEEQRAYNLALEICITWVNRLLFLKLLEAQLVQYHSGDKKYKFLNTSLVAHYDDLYDLFFEVLALKPKEREEHIQEKFSAIPYLNSSLFEKTRLEKIVGINSLNHSLKLPLYKKSVLLKGDYKKKDELETLDYLFKFLDAYDFASEGGEEVQEEGKTIINASVLGLIFEKINGYQEGAIFTPGYITTYMSKQVIEKTVIEKFAKEYPDWNVEDITDLSNYLNSMKSKSDIKKHNGIIDSLKICDPAVGSGHFLVSCLNELISIKSKLGLLTDATGSLISDYDIEIDNDEIIVTNIETSEIYQYKINNGKVHPKIQRVQKALFHEKQNLIENCLFGVDINANSVKICSLRLWIELLKNAYYTEESEFTALETLPNIDINIKHGNSLLSRFSLDENLSKVFEGKNITVTEYKKLVQDYKNTKDRKIKNSLKEKIDNVKSQFKKEALSTLEEKISRQKADLAKAEGQDDLFGEDKSGQESKKIKVKSLKDGLQNLEKRKETYETNVTFFNALEWRFEFPEVLDDKGRFIGFDIIIANPPYMRVQEIQKTQPTQKKIYEANFTTARGSYDLANLFFELAIRISHEEGNNIYIFPHKLFNSANGASLREYLMNTQCMKHIAHFGANMVFDNAITYTCIALFNRKNSESFSFQRFPYKSAFKGLLTDESQYISILHEDIQKASNLYGGNQWIFFDKDTGFEIFEKIYCQKASIENKFDDVFQGIATSKDSLYVVRKLSEKQDSYEVVVNPDNSNEKPPIKTQTLSVEKELFKPFLMGKNVHRYAELKTDRLVFFPYDTSNNGALIPLNTIKAKYPLTYDYLMQYKNVFEARESGKARTLKEWYAYIYPKNLNKFEQKKLSSMEICSYYPNVTLNNDNIYHTTKVYSFVKAKTTKEDYEYFLTILNSKLFWWFLLHTGDTLQGDARTMKTDYINPFPLPETPDAKTHKRLVTLAKDLMDAKANKMGNVSVLEDEINATVYDLYNLNQDEIDYIEARV